MLLVIPICPKDVELAIANLEWQEEIQAEKSKHDCLISYEEGTRQDLVDKARDIASRIYRDVRLFLYPTAPSRSWPQAPNWAWQNAARYIPMHWKCHWLWLEADAIPLRPGWLEALDAEYLKAGKPLMGAVVDGVVPGSHINGVAVYPADVSHISTKAFLCENAAWDVVMSQETLECRHNAFQLIHHIWGVREDGTISQTTGTSPTFTELQQVYDWVNLDAAICHRVKDASLIKWLRYMRSAEFNVPKLTMTTDAPVKPDYFAATQRTEIFIVTFDKDLPWLEYCLRSIHKWCGGFSGVTLVVPEVQHWAFVNLQGCKLCTFEEKPGKGMLHHMAIECMADQFVPAGTDCVLHVDADTIFNGPTDITQFFRDGKPIYVWRTYDSLYDPKLKVNSDCVIWKERTEAALGFSTNVYGMCVMPCINSLKLFPEFRKWIEATHKMPFVEWATSGQNSFPQTWSEYAALGAFAKELMPELYYWLDCAKDPVPKENSFHFHSHSGLTPKIREQIEGWLK